MLITIAIKLALICVFFGALMGAVAYATLMERKVAAYMQDRIGPNRAGPFGVLQPLCDGLKLFLKEDPIPTHVHKVFFFLGPAIAFIPPYLMLALIPVAPDLHIAQMAIPMQIADLNLGLLFLFALSAVGVYGLMLGSWSSNNKYSLMGGLRGAAQMISYEIPLALAISALLLFDNSFSMRDIVDSQNSFFNWYVFRQPIGFILFIIASFAETHRLPFDLPEAENELVGGYHTEFGSMKFSLFQLAEYGHLIIASAIISTLYFGGWQIPFVDLSAHLGNPLSVIAGAISFCAKTFFFVFFFMWIRWTVPRFRYDQLQKLAWKGLIPLGFINLFITAFVILILK